jgi:hypothetical protein
MVLSFMDSQIPQVVVLPTNSGTAQIPPLSTQPEPGQSTEGGGQTDGGEPAATSEACQNPVHIVTSGETLGTIAGLYGLTADDVTAMNRPAATFGPDFLRSASSWIPQWPDPGPDPPDQYHRHTANIPPRLPPQWIMPGPSASDQPGAQSRRYHQEAV